MALIKHCYFLLLAFAGGCSAKEYEWSDQASGWLKYHTVPATWDDARLSCHAEGAVLASPLTSKLNSAIKSFVQNQENLETQDVTIFTGVHATFSEGDYTSVEGVPLLRLAINWAAGEPNNYDNSERCLAMTIDYSSTVTDTRCDRKLPYVCYKKDTSKEYRYDYEWSKQAGGWLKYHLVPATWEVAKPRCESEGAILASPLTNQLQNAIIAFVRNQKSVNEQGVTIFTGVRETSKRVYSSIDGVFLQNLEITRDSEYNGSESCLALNTQVAGTMRRTNCGNVLPYVCYKKKTE